MIPDKIMPRAEDIERAMRKIEDEERLAKTAFIYVKQLSFEKFKNFFNEKHSAAYRLALKERREAEEIALTPKQVKMVEEKFRTVQTWDELSEVTVDYAEFGLYELMQVIHTEMRRAAEIHGEAFKDYAEAKEAIQEEIAEIWEAFESGDVKHAKGEAIQAIGTLVKFIRTC